jgi:hypothetical protein
MGEDVVPGDREAAPAGRTRSEPSALMHRETANQGLLVSQFHGRSVYDAELLPSG